MSKERHFCTFYTAHRRPSSLCISHETVDHVKTLCGRKVAEAVALETDTNDIDPDCRICYRAAVQLGLSQRS